MFRKTVRIKSNTQLKTSEKRKFQNKILSSVSLNEEEVREIIPLKESVSCMRIVSSSEAVTLVYIVQNTPLFFELNESLYPTVYLLWKYPKIIPSIQVHSGVIPKLMNGADLMIPGVIATNALNSNLLKDRTVVYINTIENIAAVCVGLTKASSIEMMRPGQKGKAVSIFHTFGDELFKLQETKIEFPALGRVLEESTTRIISNETPQSETSHNSDPTAEIEFEPTIDKLSELNMEKDNELTLETEEDDTRATMDILLLHSFLKSLKLAPKLTLPILTNVFYKVHVLEAIHYDGSELDLKKTKYKKLSKFLEEMGKAGIINVETSKGVQSITSINYNHKMLQEFVCEDYVRLDKTEEKNKNVCIAERKSINGSVETIFFKYKYKRGDTVTDQDIRRCVMQYVKDEDLDTSKNDYVGLNGPLCDILQTKKTHILWKDLFEGINKRMGSSYEVMTSMNQIILGKGKLPPIDVLVASKTSNKKVTLVNNLELYGINIQQFSKECQHGVAASSTINVLPKSKSVQFQIQGNQKKFIGKILTEKYNIPKRYIKGLEEPKPKTKNQETKKK